MRKLRVENFSDAMYAYAASLKEGEKGYSKHNLIHFNKGFIYKNFDESFLFWFGRFELKYSEAEASEKALRNATAEEKRYAEMIEFLNRVKNDTEGFNKFLERKKLLAKASYDKRGKSARN